jgi:regulatory protein
MRSSAELKQRLKSKGFEQDIIETVLAGLTQAELVNDAEFARMWVAERIASGAAGRQKLRWELRQKGIHEDLIRQTIDETIDDEVELEQALDLARRRLRGQPADMAGLLRLRRLLAGRGYGYGIVETVIRRLSSDAGDLDDVS